MKIAIFNSFGADFYPDKVKDKIKNKSLIDIRTKTLVDFIEKEKDLIVPTDKINLKEGECIRYGNSLYVQGDLYLSKITIVNVDTSRPWTISEYDGSEYIEYLDYDIIDKNTNFCKKRV